MKAARKLTKVLIANRGEIACRLITACHSVGLKAVAVYSEADASARHVKLADESVLIGPGAVGESYLSVPKLLEAAKKTGADGIHPGYGFLSENAAFARAVLDAGLIWIGPKPETIQLMGNKIEAKRVAEKAKVPTLPWAILAEGWTEASLREAAEKVGFPLLLKAAAGGGGRGMRLVEKTGEIFEKANAAMREAQGAFGSGELFLERYCPVARHIEVQVLGDSHGTLVTLGERECSAQRRHQKVIEEAPAPNLSEKARAALWKAAGDLARSVGYQSAGTCEFLVDENEGFYFLEMNTRLQVEHPVTELVWGVDLPALQLRVAQGEKLSTELSTLSPRGHAIEARVYAEDASKNFMPSPGRLTSFEMPSLAHLRVDTGYEEGGEVPIYYDAMLAKIIAWGMNREQARELLVKALAGATIVGVAWNRSYLIDILKHSRFVRGKISTRFLGDEFASWKGEVRQIAPSGAAQAAHDAAQPGSGLTAPHGVFPSPWVAYGPTGNGKVGSGSANSIRGHSHQHEEVGAMAAADGPLVSDYPGKVLKIFVKPGDDVAEGQTVVTCESMKMEYAYSSVRQSRVKSVEVLEGQVIPAGTVMIQWESA